jgi:bacterioferritin
MTDRIIAMLQADMRGEHQAIIQYLFHAYTIGEGEIASELEAIAREEMRHLDWLADAITELGGDPTMEREAPDLALAPVPAQLRKDAELEQGGIDQYRAHMAAIEDDSIRRLLGRIVHDEMVHKEQFLALAQQAEAEEVEGEVTEASGAPERLAEILNQGVRHEYSVILQYLYHSFVTPDKEIMEEMQNTAINEMQHMGWLAEELVEKGGLPDMNHGDLVLTRDHEEMLQADIAAEREVTGAYSEQVNEIEDEDIRRLVTRIRDHELYHDAVFGELLEEVREQAQEAADEEPPVRDGRQPTVGSLKD